MAPESDFLFCYHPNPVFGGKAFADKGTPTLVVDLLEGSFRFVTGRLEHKAYKIRAGAATLGVRETIFDVYADAKYGVVVLLGGTSRFVR